MTLNFKSIQSSIFARDHVNLNPSPHNLPKVSRTPINVQGKILALSTTVQSGAPVEVRDAKTSYRGLGHNNMADCR
ncbi:hypothetical protein RRG08_047080 [Elysia crispata]|uniref:Uncharacterized protein n=1 Tax=Elysia crispata TaxID=231223 RepID=A0AAE1DUG6_9GAST|nr:hypothetical protein RRG08_047080 [Elysia crispata]